MTPKTSITSSGDQVRNGLCTTVNRQDRFVGTLWGPFRIKAKKLTRFIVHFSGLLDVV